MINSRMILLVLSVAACLIVQTSSIIQYPNIDENTNCPIGVNHECSICAEDQNRYGCYCEVNGKDPIVTASIFTPCPADIVDPCLGNSCQNGATCAREGLTGTKCICAPGYGGALCDITLPKCSTPGINCPNAQCVETTNPQVPVYCQCYDGTQRDPQQNSTCPLSPCYEPGTEIPVCKNNGTCRIINNAHVCDCVGGFAGQNCTRTLKTPLCSSNPGVCGEGRCQQSLTPPYYACNCGNFPSTFGKELVDLTKCEESGCYSVNPCQNGGTCSNKANGAFLCQCSSRYTGAKCEKQSACYNSPCLNQGICEAMNETAFFCVCPAYYTGARCETKIPDPCATKNCGPHGECRDNAGTAACQCSDGLHIDGSLCPDPCLNKVCGTGVCTKKINATYEGVCSCPIDRMGDACESPRDVCRQKPPCGGGYCKPNYAAVRGYSCVCEGGIIKNEPCPFSQDCPIKDCGTKGICVETDGIIVSQGGRPIYYVCSCQDGYITYKDCDSLITTEIPAKANRCGPNGRPYPSRNPGNSIGCWCNNGTHVEEIEDDGPAQYCL